jgi:hypothetical protein
MSILAKACQCAGIPSIRLDKATTKRRSITRAKRTVGGTERRRQRCEGENLLGTWNSDCAE